MDNEPDTLPEPFPEGGGWTEISAWYERQLWIRAVVQTAPFAGGVDTLFAAAATSRNKKRFEELIRSVSEQVAKLDQSKLNRDFLSSDEFFEILRSSAEAAVKAAEVGKRKLVADYLAGTVRRGKAHNLSLQISEDLKALQLFHIEIIAALPTESGVHVDMLVQPPGTGNMDFETYQKGLSDLERLGFLRVQLRTIDGLGSTGGNLETTAYLKIFKDEVMKV